MASAAVRRLHRPTPGGDGRFGAVMTLTTLQHAASRLAFVADARRRSVEARAIVLRSSGAARRGPSFRIRRRTRYPVRRDCSSTRGTTSRVTAGRGMGRALPGGVLLSVVIATPRDRRGARPRARAQPVRPHDLVGGPGPAAELGDGHRAGRRRLPVDRDLRRARSVRRGAVRGVQPLQHRGVHRERRAVGRDRQRGPRVGGHQRRWSGGGDGGGSARTPTRTGCPTRTSPRCWSPATARCGSAPVAGSRGCATTSSSASS